MSVGTARFPGVLPASRRIPAGRRPSRRFSRPAPRRLRLAPLPVLCTLLAATLVFPGRAAASDSVSSAQDYAEVYLDRYFPPGKELQIKEPGKMRGIALAKYYLGLLKESQGDFDGALKYYLKVLENDPSAVKLSHRAAFLAAQDGDEERGRAILRKSLDENPESIESYLSLSDYITTFLEDTPKNRAAARRVIDEGLRKFPLNTTLIEHRIKTLVVAGETDAAETALNEALEKSTKNPRYWLGMGRIAQHVWPLPDPATGEIPRVNEIYDKAYSLAPENSRISEAVADFFHASSQHPRAVEIYREIILRDPRCITPREKLARIHMLEEADEEVVAILTELVEIHPERPETHKFLAKFYEEKEDYEKAISHYEQALRISRGSISDYFYAARLMLNSQQFQEAVDLLERARFHYNESPDLSRLLAFAYAFDKQYRRAVSTFEDTIRLVGEADDSPLDEAFYFQFAASLERDKQYDRATELFRKSISLVPEDVPELAAKSYNYLGYMWLEQDIHIDEAGEMILKANQLRPDTGAYLDSLGWFHFKKKNYREAIDHLLRAETLISQEEEQPDPVVYDHIAQTYFHLGNKSQAIEFIRKAIAADPENQEYPALLKKFQTRKSPTPPPPAEDREKAA